ncbi:hypothetical protein [Roseitranquillus sediminis]|uniref:hypothetical protein n=1 Tax=Roseitranquillus sediminis TaxID=2809051 RepID=UPI001D0C274E|nr:hypothetical protein [Roseitranquillus sediminis]MBM9596269.1 hypothetical protein [Roseitranquillus sediminis]
MSWSRRTVLAAAAATLAACGFEPALAPGSAGRGVLDDVAVEPPETRVEYHLVDRLEQRLGQPAAPNYRLDYEVEQETIATGVTADEVTTRRSVVADVAYVLSDTASGTVVRRGRVQNFTGYSATSTTVATQIGAEDAQERLMTLLADRIYYELVATASEWRR